ncbi:TadE-like protein [Aquisphaera giovannonii]|uniref:TadE-like protein n=1 Tax=Aquisphaera giovannonii TaxID=406548 RepID=A0A5B9VYF5_9BACT|nr:TadE/TadG family type IV pilus assembly protein [Aquisphaera giovannonii]QEH32961.1 TadE-like protein [Aquisphaera giovannonii]
MRIRRPGIRGRDRRAAAAVEMAVCLPLVLTMLIGTWELGRILEMQQFLNAGAREAARQAGSGLMTNSQVQQVALNYVKNALGDTSGTRTQHLAVTITVYDADIPSTAKAVDVSQADALDLLEIQVSIPYADVRWVALPTLSGAGTLSAKATWVSLKNFPFPTTVPQPPTG